MACTAGLEIEVKDHLLLDMSEVEVEGDTMMPRVGAEVSFSSSMMGSGLESVSEEHINYIAEQLWKDFWSVDTLVKNLDTKFQVQCKKKLAVREECSLLSRKQERFRQGYCRMNKELCENLSGKIESFYVMLSEISAEFARNLEKLFQEYMAAIQIMKKKMDQVLQEKILLLRKSIDLSTKMYLYDCKSCKCSVENTGGEAFKELCQVYLTAFQTIKLKMDLVQRESMLLVQKSGDLSWKSYNCLVENAAVMSKRKKYDGENVLKVESDHPLLPSSQVEAFDWKLFSESMVDDHSAVDCSEEMVVHHLSYDCEELHGGLVPNVSPPLDMGYYEEQTQCFPIRERNSWIEAFSNLLDCMKLLEVELKKQEYHHHTLERRRDVLQNQYEFWEKLCHFTAERIFEKNVYFSRQVDSLNAVLSDVSDMFMEKLQVMSSDLRGVIEWIRSRTEQNRQESVLLAQQIADQETKLCSLGNNGDKYISGDGGLCREFDRESSRGTVKDRECDAGPTCNGELMSSSEFICPLLTECTHISGASSAEPLLSLLLSSLRVID